MQVEAAAASGAVQRFTHKVQPRASLELEGRFHLGQGKPAAGGLRLPPAARGKPLEPPVLGGVGKLLPAACGQGVGGGIRQGGGSPEGAAKLAVQKPQPERRRRVLGKQRCTRRKQGGKLCLRHSGEEIQLHRRVLRAAPGGKQAGQLHDADAGKPVVGELHLAHLLGEHPVAVQQAGGGLGADARKALVRLCALQSGQAGVKGAHLPAAVGGKAGAEAVRAELRPGGAAHGADNGICPQAFGAALGVRKLHGVAALALPQGAYRAAGAQLYLVPLQMQLQQRQHVCRLIGIGVHPPGFIGAGVQPQLLKPRQRRGSIHRRQQRPQRGGVGGEIFLRRNGGVVQIAAAVAGSQQLFAHLGVALQHRDAGSGRGLCSRQRSGQSGGTAAQNKDVCHADTCFLWFYSYLL